MSNLGRPPDVGSAAVSAGGLGLGPLHQVAQRASDLARSVAFYRGVPGLVHRDADGTFGAPGDEEWMTFFRDPDGNLLALVSRR